MVAISKGVQKGTSNLLRKQGVRLGLLGMALFTFTPLAASAFAGLAFTVSSAVAAWYLLRRGGLFSVLGALSIGYFFLVPNLLGAIGMATNGIGSMATLNAAGGLLFDVSKNIFGVLFNVAGDALNILFNIIKNVIGGAL